MTNQARRRFLSDVGRGMLVATIGPAVAMEFGLPRVFAEEDSTKLTFGEIEPLVALIEESTFDRLLPLLVDRLRTGTTLRELVSAGALASARTRATDDYNGLHAFLALAPSYAMA